LRIQIELRAAFAIAEVDVGKMQESNHMTVANRVKGLARRS
jgi:hypothetical protein